MDLRVFLVLFSVVWCIIKLINMMTKKLCLTRVRHNKIFIKKQGGEGS